MNRATWLGTRCPPPAGAADGPSAASRRGMRAVVTAAAVSGFGNQMTMLALPWLILETTGSATRTSLVLVIQLLPMALLGLIGGEVLQRFGSRPTMLVSDGARGVLVASVPLLHGAGLLSFPALLAIVAMLGVAGVPYAASQRLLATELLGDDPRALTRANGTLDAVYQAAGLGGPVAAGALIAVVGAAQVLWLDATSFAVSFLVLRLVLPSAAGRTAPGAGTPPPRGALAGIRHLATDPFLRRTMVSTVVGGFVLRFLAICLPLLAFRRFDGDAALGGVLLASIGAGMLAGSFLAVLLARRFGPVSIVAVAMVFQSLPLWLLGLPVPPSVLALAVAVSGAAMTLSNAPYFSLLNARVPAALRPKVLQAVMTLSTVGGPLGLLTAGVVLDAVGVVPTLLGVAGVATAASVNVLLVLNLLTPTPLAPAQPVDCAKPSGRPTELG